ncbi:MAG: ATP synthase F1 subunit gamma [Bacteroidales bacterium]|nr:ATP synthase F1 subunit gamma [Bacteroidales bacterium]
MATIREIKGRITSTKSSEKITGAMKMISSAKLRKAEGALRMMHPYRNQLSSVISHLLSSDGDYPSPLTEIRSVSRFAFVIIGSEEGLCGAYNVYLFKKLLERMEYVRNTYGEECQITLYPLGKKMTSILSKMQGVEVKKSEYLTAKSPSTVIREFTDDLISNYLSKNYDEVEVIYPKFKSMASQPVETRTLLPIDSTQLSTEQETSGHQNPYIYEPTKQEIFLSILPLFVRVDMQDAIYNGRASEQAARVIAMQSASDNAKKLLEELQLDYNKLRQQGITNELLDIVGGSMH